MAAGEADTPLLEQAAQSSHHGSSESSMTTQVLRLWSEALGEDPEGTPVQGSSFDFFEFIGLARDNGLSDIREEVLLYPGQYVQAAMSVTFILMNIVYVTTMDSRCLLFNECTPASSLDSEETACVKSGVMMCSDLACIRSLEQSCTLRPTAPDPTGSFLLSRWLLATRVPGEKLVAGLELLLLWILIMRTVRLSLQAVLCRLEVLRWVCISKIFWQTVPSLSCFSLLRLLYYVTPAVVGTEAYYVFAWTRERITTTGHSWTAWWPIISYTVSRLFCAVVGFDAFLVKYRMAAGSILGQMTSSNLLKACLFLFQLLGVVSLSWYARQRLFFFVFGNEDGSMSNAQKAREIVWNALVARRAYENLGFQKFLVVMLGFDDYDFQVLVMDNRPQRATCPAGHLLETRTTPLPKCDVCGTWFTPFTALEGCGKCRFLACDQCKNSRTKELPLAAQMPNLEVVSQRHCSLEHRLLGISIET
mmetsp:Transcript_22095/g.50491  ORF Transcript_22095/g.50491 Transcript_22095/m.50491 type:complete len:476 (-) Transcript_22095:25-1452(-)